MKLDAYDVKLTLSDPNDPETAITLTIKAIPRDKILTVPLPMAETLKEFEAMIADIDEQLGESA